MNSTIQRQFKLTVPRLAGESQRLHSYRVRELNDEKFMIKPAAPDSMLCDLLKKQARAVMADITECPAPALPAHITRLENLREIICLAMANELVPANETRLSSKQLTYASTLADFLACLELTRKDLRAPAFVNQRDEDLAKLWHGMELIAGMVAQLAGISVPETFTNSEGESER